MSGLNKIKLVSLILLRMTASLSAQNADDFLRFLEARNDSIKSFEIKLRQASFTIELKDYEAFKDDIEKIEQNKNANLSISEQAEQLVQKWGEPNHWFERDTIQQGERFKETQFRNGSEIDVSCYNGLLYYDYSVRNQQFDIYSKVPNIKHTDLTDIGFGFNAEALRSWGKILSFEQNEKNIQLVFAYSGENSPTITQIYSRDLGLCYSQTKITEQIQLESCYLFLKNIEGYQVPGITIEINRYGKRNECSVWLYVIEDVKFNPFLTNEDFTIGKVPDKTLVIDYRFNPEEQMRYGEYRYAAVNPNIVQAGLREPEELIKILENSRSSRESLSVRDSRTGRQAPSLDIQQWLNKPVDLNTWPPGKLTVVNFWDIWCGFCTREIPENNELSKWLDEKGILFFSIHIATKELDSVMNYIQDTTEKPDDVEYINKIQYPVALDKAGTQRIGWSSATFNNYGVDGIPCYVIIDKKGNLISYERNVDKQNLEKLLSGDKEEAAKLQKSTKPVRKLNAVPNGWFTENLTPNSQVKGRFFIYREETPDLIFRNIDADNAIESQWLQHTSSGQTVGELLLSVDAPDWGKTNKGNIAVITEHSQVSELITIPYELTSRSIAECASPVIWFGSVQKGSKATRRITLQGDSSDKISLHEVSVPSNLRLEILDIGQKSNNIFIDCVFSSTKSGFQQGNVELQAVNEQSNEQFIKLEYCAFVQQ
jgi:thiol-disulfide isomerase/thioredoxin